MLLPTFPAGYPAIWVELQQVRLAIHWKSLDTDCTGICRSMPQDPCKSVGRFTQTYSLFVRRHMCMCDPCSAVRSSSVDACQWCILFGAQSMRCVLCFSHQNRIRAGHCADDCARLCRSCGSRPRSARSAATMWSPCCTSRCRSLPQGRSSRWTHPQLLRVL